MMLCIKSRTRQSRKVLWVVFSSLFFKQISKYLCLQVLKESIKSRFDSYSVRNSLLIISHITFRDCRVHSFFDNLSRNSCIQRNLDTTEGPRDWQNLFAIRWFRYIEVIFHIFYYHCYYWGKENSSLYRLY